MGHPLAWSLADCRMVERFRSGVPVAQLVARGHWGRKLKGVAALRRATLVRLAARPPRDARALP
jgi:hypothetical protein